MSTKVKKQGHYELFETDNGNRILSLNNQDWYALIKGQQGDIIVHSDSDHQKKKSLQKGDFYLADFENEPDFNDIPHLFLQKEDRFEEMILPNGLPTKSDKQKKVIYTDELVSGEMLREHVG